MNMKLEMPWKLEFKYNAGFIKKLYKQTEFAEFQPLFFLYFLTLYNYIILYYTQYIFTFYFLHYELPKS